MLKRHATISDIGSQRTRSLLRGLTNRGADSYTKTLNNLRATKFDADTEVVAELLISSPLLSHLPLPDDFPTYPTTARSFERLGTQSLEAELTYQCLRIKKHSEKLRTAIEGILRINEALFSDDATKAFEEIRHFVEKFGYSNVVMHKLAYLLAAFGDDTAIGNQCRTELEKYGLKRRASIVLAAVDMMGDIYPFLPLRRNLLEYVENNRKTPTSRDIVSYQFRPIRFQRDDLASQLQSHGLFSVLDAMHFVFIHRFNVNVFEVLEVESRIDKYLDTPLVETWISRQRKATVAVCTVALNQYPS
jgi:hypothetical protein